MTPFSIYERKNYVSVSYVCGFLKSRQFSLWIQCLASTDENNFMCSKYYLWLSCTVLKIIMLKITTFISSCNFELGYKIGSWIQRLLHVD